MSRDDTPAQRCCAVLGVAIKEEAPPAAEWLATFKPEDRKVVLPINGVVVTLLNAAITIMLERKGVDVGAELTRMLMASLTSLQQPEAEGSRRVVLEHAIAYGMALARDEINAARDRATIARMRAAEDLLEEARADGDGKKPGGN